MRKDNISARFRAVPRILTAAVLLCAAACGRSGAVIQGPCDGAACSGHGSCFVAGGQPFCACETGYHPGLLACVADDGSDPCAGVRCNEHGSCRVTGGNPACDCDEGYRRPAETELLCFHDASFDATGGEDAGGEDLQGETDGEGADVPEGEPSICGNRIVEPGEECDDGRDGDPDDGCTDECRFTCGGDPDCDDGLPCTDDTCDPSTHRCSSSTSPATRVCRPPAEPCDPEEYCNGEGTGCPPDGVSCWSHVAAGETHTCAISTSGELYCWGLNIDGQVGDGTTENRSLPARVGVETDWRSVSSGSAHTCAVKTSDALYCWGRNATGQLGIGSSTGSFEPVRVGVGLDWVSAACGSAHTCALKTNGTAFCWGWNGAGQLGDGSTTGRNSPVQVSGATLWSFVTTGYNHSCGINEAATLAFCWGDNDYGKLGDDSTVNRLMPVGVAHYSEPAMVSTGYGFTCSTRTAGEIFCWGNDRAGQLGSIDTAVEVHHPVMTGADDDWAWVDAGGDHACAVKQDHALYCWGSNFSGQLGDGTLVGRDLPAQLGTDTDWSDVSAGSDYTCALKLDGRLYCWGYNNGGQIGDGTTLSRFTPTLVVRY